MSLEPFARAREFPGTRPVWRHDGLADAGHRDRRPPIASSPAPLDASFASTLLSHRRLFDQVDALRQPMADALLLMADAVHRGGRLIFFGNGLGGVVARLLADTFVAAVPAYPSRRPVSAPALALVKDEGAHGSFADGIRARGRTGDCAVALSASGRSRNILSAMLAAHDSGMVNIAFLGQVGQALPLADVALVCGHSDPARVHEAQLFIGHTLCTQLTRALQSPG